jgi:hypothetical protein
MRKDAHAAKTDGRLMPDVGKVLGTQARFFSRNVQMIPCEPNGRLSLDASNNLACKPSWLLGRAAKGMETSTRQS